jgi:hypothetical protein
MHGQFQIIDFLDSFQLILDMWDIDGKLFMLDTNSNTTYDENANQRSGIAEGIQSDTSRSTR